MKTTSLIRWPYRCFFLFCLWCRNRQRATIGSNQSPSASVSVCVRGEGGGGISAVRCVPNHANILTQFTAAVLPKPGMQDFHSHARTLLPADTVLFLWFSHGVCVNNACDTWCDFSRRFQSVTVAPLNELRPFVSVCFLTVHTGEGFQVIHVLY